MFGESGFNESKNFNTSLNASASYSRIIKHSSFKLNETSELGPDSKKTKL